MPITNWSIRHSVTIFVFVAVLFIVGLVAYNDLPREASPDIKIPLVLVTVPYVGVSPSDIETLVTNPLEEELERLKDVEIIRSTSAEGASIVSIEFTPGINIDDALQKVRERVDAARPELPADAEDPVISEIAFSEFPVITVNVSGDIGLLGLKRVAEDLQDEIERIQGILEVKLIGGVDREITVEADPALLEYYGVTLLETVGVIQNANVNLPGGSIDVGDYKFLVRVPGEFERVSDIENLVIRVEEGQPIFVRDVARVLDGYEDQATFSRLGGVESVTLTVSRRAGENIIGITDQVKEIVARYQSDYEGSVQFTLLSDVSNNIRSQLDELENNILTGLILVVGVLFLFMGGIRNALFVGSAIPLSMLISFIVLQALGVTLNIVVLFSLVLALGMLVDNAIVVVENVYRHGTMGKSRVQAAMDGVEEIAWPIISSTATTVFAFVPLLFWPGIMGEFMYFMPLTVVIVLSSSLFVALVINPVFCAAMMRIPKSAIAQKSDDELASLPSNWFYRAYGAFLRFCVNQRVLVLFATAVLFVGTLRYYGANNAGVEFFPSTTPERIYVNVTLPDGSNVEASDRIVRRVEAVLHGNGNIASFVADVGAGNGDQMNFGSDGTAPHRSRITVEFVALDEQVENVFDTMARIRENLTDIIGADFEIKMEQGGPPQGAPVNIELVGKDYLVLADLAERVGNIIRSVDGAIEVQDDFEAGRTEIAIDVDRVEASRVRVSTMDVANTVRAAINGITASKFRDGTDEYDINVRLAETFRGSIEDIEKLQVSNSDGDRVQLTEIARVETRRGYGSIRHIDGDRVITVQSEVAEGYNANAVLQEVQARIARDLELPAGYQVRYTGQNKEQAEAANFLGRALMSGLFLIALVLITQFNSILQPGIILASVILSLLGVLWGLLIRGAPFSIIMTGVGVISLAGVVVNNAIVLIDYINQLRARGMSGRDAVIQAGLVRLRPVLLTAITTALSLLPTVLGYSLDVKNLRLVAGGTSVEMWSAMANAVVAGLAVSTVLTLIVVPVLYSSFDSFSNGMKRLLARFRPLTAEEARAADRRADAAEVPMPPGAVAATARAVEAPAADETTDVPGDEGLQPA